ncbi:DUF4442 domain-containing protein [bacterium]|nr:DUF4442 domain-containing protein [bacterium]
MIEEKYKDIAELATTLVGAIQRTGLKVLALRDRYAKFMMPLEGNTNHVGSIYAGSLFTLGEFTGGIIPGVTFDISRFYPIVKEVTIRYISYAKTDVTIEHTMSKEEADRIQAEVEANGKADFAMELEIKNTNNETVALVNGIWQMRTIPEAMREAFNFSKT